MVRSTGASVLRVENLQVRRGTFELGPVELNLAAGLSVLLGRNGAGKSTLIATVVGLSRPRRGVVEIGGVSPYGRRRREAMRRVGLVPQDSSLPAGATLDAVLDYAGWLKSVARADVTRRAPVILEALDLSDLSTRKIGSLSGGERRRASIAVSLIHEPELLVLDEPTVGLDPVQRLGLRQIVESIARERCVLMSTHLVEDLSAGVDRVLALSAGRFVFDGAISELEALAGAPDPGRLGGSMIERGVWKILTGSAGRSPA